MAGRTGGQCVTATGIATAVLATVVFRRSDYPTNWVRHWPGVPFPISTVVSELVADGLWRGRQRRPPLRLAAARATLLRVAPSAAT